MVKAKTKQPVAGNLKTAKRVWQEAQKQAEQKGTFLASSASFGKTKPKVSLKTPVFVFTRDDFASQTLPPFGQVAEVLQQVLGTNYKGPVFLQAQLEVNPDKYKHTLRKEINLVKKQIKNCRQAGIYNTHVDCIGLNPEASKRVIDNLKRLADFLQNRTSKKPTWWKNSKHQAKQELNLTFA